MSPVIDQDFPGFSPQVLALYNREMDPKQRSGLNFWVEETEDQNSMLTKKLKFVRKHTRKGVADQREKNPDIYVGVPHIELPKDWVAHNAETYL